MAIPFAGTEIYAWIILPILIFLARIVDVSMGTVRVIFITRGHKTIAPLIGFFEVLVWLLAVKQIMTDVTNIVTYIGYAGGFATGTYVGIYIEERLSIGKVMLRITTRKKSKTLLEDLKGTRHFITSNQAEGPKGKVTLIHMTIPRQEVRETVNMIRKRDPNAIYSIEDVRYAHQPVAKDRYSHKFDNHKKGK